MRSSFLGIVLAPLAIVACTSTRTVETRTPAGSEFHLEPAPGSKRPILSEWTATADGVRGQLGFGKCVKVVEEREAVTQVQVKGPDKTANAILLLGGLAATAAGGVMYSKEHCSSQDEGSYSDGCKAANVTVATGLVSAVAGGLGFSFAEQRTERAPRLASSTRRESGQVPCGGAKDLSELTLKLDVSGLGEFTATPDAEGRVKFTLPPSTSFDTSARFPVVIASKGDSKNPLLREGTELGRLNLEPFANLVRERQASQLAVGDQAEFENVVHGDPAARNGFTTECSPSGKDVCFDAIDNDCDGLYDVGCGYQSGALQWTLAWRTGDDLDLHVVGPDGHHVWYQHKQGAAAGLQLDVDCRGQFGNNCLAQNVENIFTPRDRKPMEGTYRGWVEVFDAVKGEDAGRVVAAMLGGRVAGKTFRMPMNLQAQNGVRVYFAFAIGKDRDKDSVIDRQDACPDQPGVFSYLAQENGCPDQDMDGVADKVDACPAEPGVRDADGRKNGCARSYGHARLTARGVEIDDSIRFATGSATLLPDAYPLLKDVARVMRELPQALQEIRIEGHTDDVGEEAKNYELSKARVKAVFEHLYKKERISTSRLNFAWFGEARPIRDNSTDAGRAANRRVEFRVVKPEPQIVLSW